MITSRESDHLFPHSSSSTILVMHQLTLVHHSMMMAIGHPVHRRMLVAHTLMMIVNPVHQTTPVAHTRMMTTMNVVHPHMRADQTGNESVLQ